jgi:leader peptidase (prepilin peptidase)/N-methyltransferase
MQGCGLPISRRYPLVELLNALLYGWVYRELGLSGEAILIMALCSSLLVITFIDLDHQIIPDVITLPGMVLGLVVAPFFMPALAGPLPFALDRFMPQDWPHLERVINSFIGLACGRARLVLGWIWESCATLKRWVAAISSSWPCSSFLAGKTHSIIVLGAITGSVVGVTLILLRKHKADHYSLRAVFAGELATMLRSISFPGTCLPNTRLFCS